MSLVVPFQNRTRCQHGNPTSKCVVCAIKEDGALLQDVTAITGDVHVAMDILNVMFRRLDVIGVRMP